MNLRSLTSSLSRRSIFAGVLSVAAGVAAAPLRSVPTQAESQAQAQDASPTVCQTSSVAENEALVRKFFDEVWNNANVDLIGELFATEVDQNFGNLVNPDGTDIAEMTARISERRLVDFPDLHVTVEDLFGEGDLVVARTYWTGTHADELVHDDFETNATGIQFGYPGFAMFRFACGKIAQHWIANDELGLLQQIGAIPTATTPTAVATPPAAATGSTPGATDCATTTPAENTALVRRLHEEALNGNTLSLIDELHAEGHQFHSEHRGPNDTPYASDDIAEAMYEEWLGDFTNRQATIAATVVNGDRVAVLWTTTGEMTGDFEQTGHQGNGTPVTFNSIASYRIACGEIAETWFSWDSLLVYRQLIAAGSAATPTS